uniref:Mitochondrial 2-oxoglutarate/malate carrier protein n=2 Tax=Bombyx TaxID=7090 RepID=A0A8R2MAK8_BOMMO|nr:mitochondrial 2-oxoglutarate/malate carrier protein [Bombyx mori]
MTATTILHPLDLAKVRMQVCDHPGSTLNVIRHVGRCEGYGSLYTGLSAALLRQATYTSTRLAVFYFLYDEYRRKYCKAPCLNEKIIMGMYAGLAGAFIGNPSEVALVRLMADGPRYCCYYYCRPYTGTFDAICKIIRYESISGLWRGGVLTSGRSLIVTAAQIGSYAKTRRALQENKVAKGLELHFYTSMISSFIAAVISLPIDHIKTRYQVRSDCVTQKEILADTRRNRGIFGLWRGFTPYYLRMAFHTFITFYLLEQFFEMYQKWEEHERKLR